MVKFPTKNGIGQIRGNQAMARQYFIAKLRAKGQPSQAEVQPELPIRLDARDDLVEERTQPFEDLLEVSLRKENPNQIVKIGLHLHEETKTRLTTIL